MSEETGLDFLTQYKNINNKLKKRFFRKTNVAEPSDQFASLAVQCEKFDLPEYAALSWLGVASCEASLGHTNEEAAALANAGRHFISAESKTLIGCNELSKAGRWWLKQSEKVMRPGKPESSDLEHLSTPPLLPNKSSSPHQRLLTLESSALHYLSIGDYETSLNTFTELVSLINSIVSVPFGIYKDISLRCEVLRVLLVLVLGPSPQRLSHDLAKLLDKYTWVGEPDHNTKSLIGEELFFLLQALVMSCQSHDSAGVLLLEPQLSVHLTKEQSYLLIKILEQSHWW